METSKEINIRVLDRALDVLECFSEDTRELNLMDVVEKTGLSASTAHRIIRGLERRDYREFNISEVWLRTGEGEPHIQRDEDAEWQEVLAQITVSDDEVIRRIIKAYWFMDEKEKAAVRKLIDGFTEQKK